MRYRLLLEGKKENLALINPVLDAIVTMGRDPLTVRRDDPAIDLVEKYREKIKENWATTVERASAALTKQDVLSWYLRLALQYTIRSWAKALDPAKVGAMEQAYFRKVGLSVDNDDFEGSASLARLVHFLSLPIAGIRNYQYRHQSFREVMSDFQDMEDRWQATVDRLVDDEDAVPVIDFGNGWFWMNLEKPSCDKESKAMGHCGNSPREGSDDTILSLRKKIRYGAMTRWEPSLTFILTRDGMLTEMKGRGNDKPVAKYHEMIIALLLNPIVKGIVGGGYKPKNNFSLDDLAEDDRAKLLEEKPSLGSLWEMYQAEGLTQDVKSRIDAILKTFSDHGEIYDYSPDTVTLHFYKSINEFLKTMGIGNDHFHNQSLLNLADGDDDELYWLGEPTGYDALGTIMHDQDHDTVIRDFVKKLSQLTGVSDEDALPALKHLFPDAIEQVFEHAKVVARSEARKTVLSNIEDLRMVYLHSRCYVEGTGVVIKCPLNTFIRDLSNAMEGNTEGESPILLTVLNNNCDWGMKRGYYSTRRGDITKSGQAKSFNQFFREERQRFLDLILDLFHTGS